MRYSQHYSSNLFRPADPTAFHNFCSRWRLTLRMGAENLVGFDGDGLPQGLAGSTIPLPDAFWVELRRVLAEGAAVVVLENIYDFDGVTVVYHIVTSDGEHEAFYHSVMVTKISKDQWAQDYPDEPYPYEPDRPIRMNMPYRQVQVVVSK